MLMYLCSLYGFIKKRKGELATGSGLEESLWEGGDLERG